MRIIAQVAPASAALTDAYEVPEDRTGGVAITSVRVVNRGSGRLRAMVAIASDGAVHDTSQVWAENVDVPYGKVVDIPINVVVPANGIVRVKATGTATFAVMGD